MVRRTLLGLLLISGACFAEGQEAEKGENPESKRQAEERLKGALAELGEGYRGAVEGCFLVMGNLSKAQLDRYVEGTIRSCAEKMARQFFDKKPEGFLKVYLFWGEEVYRAKALELFNDDDVSYYGYYSSFNRALVMNIRTGGGTLIHEMFHALVEPDFPDIPAWYNEGMGSLYEACWIKDDRLDGMLINWRFKGLKEAIKEGRLVRLRDLVATSTRKFYGPGSGLHYAQARYFCLYLQEKGLLEKFYRSFRDSVEKDSTGRTQLEELLGKKLDEVERDWLEWIKTLREEN